MSKEAFEYYRKEIKEKTNRNFKKLVSWLKNVFSKKEVTKNPDYAIPAIIFTSFFFLITIISIAKGFLHFRTYYVRVFNKLSLRNNKKNEQENKNDNRESNSNLSNNRYLNFPDDVERVDIGGKVIPLSIYRKLKKEAELVSIDHSLLKRNQIILDLPWYIMAKENDNIEEIKNEINNSHYGMETVKNEIISFLSSRILAKKAKKGNFKGGKKGNVICLVGAPGVGKTSIAKSIARALHRPFQQIALGGVDSSQFIRGSEKVFIGSEPGRIINSIIKAGVDNPVILLDEVDKVIRNKQTSSIFNALLEILDPSQNDNFKDNFLEVPYDLSNVLFILTANYIQNIPNELIDRMHVIQLENFTRRECREIIKNYTIPKILKECGLPKNSIQFKDSAIEFLIDEAIFEKYNRSIRDFEKAIFAIVSRIIARQNGNLSKICKEVVDGEKACFMLHNCCIKNYIHKPDFKNKIGEMKILGVNRIMVGFISTLIVSAIPITSDNNTLVNFNDKIYTVGPQKTKGGDVPDSEGGSLKSIGFLYQNANKYKINKKVFEKSFFILETPWGGGGASNGLAKGLCVLSYIKKIPIRGDTVVTGQLSINGKVSRIGGVRGKVTNAIDSGYKRIIVPAENRDEIEMIPEEDRKNVTFYFVDNFDEAVEAAFTHGI